MKRFIVHLSAGLIAFLLGSSAVHLPVYFQSLGRVRDIIAVESLAMPSPELSSVRRETRNLSPREAEIVAKAEHFVCWNGYTHQGCGGVGRIYFDPAEKAGDMDKIWARRRDTLEGKAYGVIMKKKGESTFWTVVFTYTARAGKNRESVGCAYVTEEGRFSTYLIGLRHDFPLAEVKQKS